MSVDFEFPVRVYWEDTDAGGIVYHASYLRFLERGRSEWLRHRGVDQAALRARDRVQFAVVNMQIEWKRAARFDEELVVVTALSATGGASFSFTQRIRRGAELVVAATVRAAALDAETLRPRRLPTHIARLLA